MFILSFSAAAAAAPPIRVLIIDGFSNHDWRMTTARVVDILRRDGGFSTLVSTSPDSTASPEEIQKWLPPLEQADVILMNCNDLAHPVDWSPAARQAIERFVHDGGGMYALHSANNSFADWPEYNRMIGMGWRKKDYGTALEVDANGQIVRIPPGEGDRTSHGKRVDALVTQLGEHPIHAGLPHEWRVADAEVYTFVRGPAENVQVISYSNDNRYHIGFPVEWVVQYGRGRVYTSSLGHLWKGDVNPPAFRCVAFQTLMVRALRWVAHREIDPAPPPDFPSAQAVSLR
jgi:uncharacterized protein